jgi:hypothetical protein
MLWPGRGVEGGPDIGNRAWRRVGQLKERENNVIPVRVDPAAALRVSDLTEGPEGLSRGTLQRLLGYQPAYSPERGSLRRSR